MYTLKIVNTRTKPIRTEFCINLCQRQPNTYGTREFKFTERTRIRLNPKIYKELHLRLSTESVSALRRSRWMTEKPNSFNRRPWFDRSTHDRPPATNSLQHWLSRPFRRVSDVFFESALLISRHWSQSRLFPLAVKISMPPKFASSGAPKTVLRLEVFTQHVSS